MQSQPPHRPPRHGPILDPSEPTTEEHAYLSALLDPATFIESSLFIIDKDSKQVPFILNDLQRRYLASRSHRDIILKSRKMGFSTLIMALWLHECITKMHTKAVIVSHEKDSTQRLFDRFKFMLTHCAYPGLKYEITKSGAVFPDTESSIWIGTAGSRNFGRGDDVTNAHFSEPAFYDDLSVLTSVGEALVHDGYMILESTANGAGTPYHDLWLHAQRGENAYKPHFFGWNEDASLTIPGSKPVELDAYEKKAKEAFNLSWDQLAWRRQKRKEMTDPSLSQQEYPITPEEAFLASGRMVFAWDSIKIQDDEAKKTPVKWRGDLIDAGSTWRVDPREEGPLQIWKSQEDRQRYLLTVDCSQGIRGRDYSVADVWKMRTWEQVAQFRGHPDPDKFIDIVYGLGCMYGWGVVAVEDNYPGNSIIDGLTRKKYPNMWVDPSGDARDERAGGRPGFKTTEKTKNTFISDLRQALRDMDIRINSKYTIMELNSFIVTDSGKMEAAEGCHDDTVISAAIAAYILKRWTLEPETEMDSRRDHFTLREKLRGARRGGFGRPGGGSTIV